MSEVSCQHHCLSFHASCNVTDIVSCADMMMLLEILRLAYTKSILDAYLMLHLILIVLFLSCPSPTPSPNQTNDGDLFSHLNSGHIHTSHGDRCQVGER